MSLTPQQLQGKRLSSGKCPEHGKPLTWKENFVENGSTVGRIYGCGQCDFQIEARFGSRLVKLLGP